VYHVEIAPAANDQMYTHVEFLARVDADAAAKMLDKFLQDIHSLEKLPQLNPPYNRAYLPVGKYRYKVSGRRYLIIFQVVGQCVYVDEIRDCRQREESGPIFQLWDER
jgi:hypothetical protein